MLQSIIRKWICYRPSHWDESSKTLTINPPFSISQSTLDFLPGELLLNRNSSKNLYLRGKQTWAWAISAFWLCLVDLWKRSGIYLYNIQNKRHLPKRVSLKRVSEQESAFTLTKYVSNNIVTVTRNWSMFKICERAWKLVSTANKF